MCIEERINQLEEKLEFTLRKLDDLLAAMSSEKPILNFYTYEVPVPWEDFTDTAVGITINGVDLTYTDNCCHEVLVLDNIGAYDWVYSLGYSLSHLPISKRNQSELYDKIVYLSSLGYGDEKRFEIYSQIEDKIKSLFVLKYDSQLSCDYKEFTF